MENNRYFEIATTILSIIIAKGLTVRQAQEVLKNCNNLILDTKVNGVCKDEDVTCIYSNNSGADKNHAINVARLANDSALNAVNSVSNATLSEAY